MLIPRQAPVRPRVLSPQGDVALPLDEEILALLEEGEPGAVALLGPPGSGKTTALQHLAAVLPRQAPVTLLDGPARAQVLEARRERLAIYAAAEPCVHRHLRTYRLAPWDKDSLIEYLLATHRSRCASVMRRLCDADQALFRGTPELWRVVLDELALDPALPDARAALHRYLDAQLPDTDLLQRARSACLNALAAEPPHKPQPVEQLGEAGFIPGVVRVLRHPAVQRQLAAERIAADLRDGGDCDYLALALSRGLIRAAAALAAEDGRALERLRDLVAGPPWGQAMAASLLLAAVPDWRPEPDQVPVLAGAHLGHALWAGVRLPEVNLCRADLRQADLSGADLDGADASRARLTRARLTGASLKGLKAMTADLSGADLSAARGQGAQFYAAVLAGADLTGAAFRSGRFNKANLSGAVLTGADLAGASFRGATIRGADFSGANLAGADLAELPLCQAVLRGACLRQAWLRKSDLEELDLAGVDLRSACLTGALLTGANLAGANLSAARLCGARLGEVNLEHACLRDANLRGATFQMGSTRSGTLITPIASEGTRTGFYTEESEEQYFKSPEEIRKANLCGADLRGALIDGVDFYLVDLRGALYDPAQEVHFRRCRAILDAPG
jgi:uncharacterized protein YjbI with pentapeptide repeats/energy-coupling factor transporter ATP-binding protein EcfA2